MSSSIELIGDGMRKVLVISRNLVRRIMYHGGIEQIMRSFGSLRLHSWLSISSK